MAGRPAAVGRRSGGGGRGRWAVAGQGPTGKLPQSGLGRLNLSSLEKEFSLMKVQNSYVCQILPYFIFFSIKLLSPVLYLILLLIALELVNIHVVHGKNTYEYQQYLK